MSKRALRSSQDSAAAAEEFTLSRNAKLTRTGLLLGTALGCSIAVFSLSAPSTAWAVNECGPLVASGGVDKVTCAPGAYPSGITYTDTGGNPVVVTLGPGADPTDPVFVENTAPGAYAGVVTYAGSTITTSGTALGVYTSAGGDVFADTSGKTYGGTNGIFADALATGNVEVANFNQIEALGNVINARTTGGNVGVYTTFIGEGVGGYTGTTTGISVYAVNGTGDVTVGNRGVSLTSTNGYVVGINSATTFNNTTKVYGSVYTQGYTGSMGIKTSSAVNAATYVYGDVTVKSGLSGAGGGAATGIITVGSNYAFTSVTGNVSVTAPGGTALGIESSSFNGSSVSVGGNIDVVASLGAIAVYDRTIYDRGASVDIGGNVTAYSDFGSAVGIFALAGNVVANDFTNVDVVVGGSVKAYAYDEATAIYTKNLGGDVYVSVGGNVFAQALGDATGIRSYAYDSTIIHVEGYAAATSILGNATAINVSGADEMTTTAYSVEAVAFTGRAVGVNQYVTAGGFDNNVHIYSDVYVNGYAGATGVNMFANGGAKSYGNVVVGGNVVAISADGDATGVFNGGYNASSTVVGNVTVSAVKGNAFGMYTVSSNGAYTGVGGDVTATSKYGRAYGIDSFVNAGGNYDNTIIVGGNVTVRGYKGAFGVIAQGGYVDISVAGDVNVTTTYGAAWGVVANGDATVFVGGNVSAYSELGDAIAVTGNSTGYLGITVDGYVEASSFVGNATGISSNAGGSVDIYVGGNVGAYSVDGAAVGVKSYSFDGTELHVVGNVVANSFDGTATGVNVSAYGGIATTVGGSVVAFSDDRTATGVYAFVTQDNSNGYINSVTVGGNVTAIGYTGAVGVRMTNLANDSNDVLNVTGNVVAETVHGDAFGVEIDNANTANVTIGGMLYALSNYGNATGLSAITLNDASINIGGDAVARAYGEAIGVESESKYGNVSITVGENAAAYSTSTTGVAIALVAVTGNGTANINVAGDVFATGNTAAGVEIEGNAGSYVTIGGSMDIQSDHGNAYGVFAISPGSIGVSIGENVYVDSSYAQAVGMLLETDDNIDVLIGGNLSVVGSNGTAVGILAESIGGGNGNVSIAGNVTVEGYYGAVGIEAVGESVIVHVGENLYVAAGNGDVGGIVVESDGTDVYVGGNATAKTNYGDAIVIGVESFSSGNGFITVNGDVYGASGHGNATGILDTAPFINIQVGGNVTVHAYGEALGIGAYGGETAVYVDGNVDVTSSNGNATGVKVIGDASIYIGGNATAVAPVGNATAVSINSTDYAYAHVVGNVYAGGGINATGVYNYATGYSKTVVGGNVLAKSIVGLATGVYGYSETNAVYIKVGGDVTAISSLDDATGVYASGATGETVDVTGSVGAEAYGAAIGVQAIGSSYANVTIGGNAEALAVNGDAFAVEATGDDVNVHVDGDVGAYSKYADATGVSAISTGFSGVSVGGDVYALAPDGNATGITVAGGKGGFYADVYVGGNVSATGKYSATGVSITSSGENYTRVDGNVTAVATDGSAAGVTATSAYTNATVYVGGSVGAAASINATGISVNAGGITGGYGDVTVIGDVTAEAGTGTAAGVVAEGGHTDVIVGGNVTAVSNSGTAVGIESVAEYGVNVTVDGNVYAHSVSGNGAIGVIAASDGYVTVNVGGTTEVIGKLAYGVFAESEGGGAVGVYVGNVSVHQSNATSPYEGAGIITYTSGVTNITAGDIYTTGNLTDGVRAGRKVLDNGDTYVTVASVETTGAYSVGVYVYGPGNATVNAGTTYTKGYKSDGLYAVSTAGGVNVTSTMVKTLGDYSVGIFAEAGGPVVVTSGTAVTFGYKSDGVMAINTGTT
ncbi:MAG TPA: hypothetical protein VGL66_00370, partial [Caulobacteraceae bacterium]